MPLTVDSTAKTDSSGTIRLVIAALVLGVVVTGVVAFALDGFLLRRRARRAINLAKGSTTIPAAESETSIISHPRPVGARIRRGR
jgi:hypothetical protein